MFYARPRQTYIFTCLACRRIIRDDIESAKTHFTFCTKYKDRLPARYFDKKGEAWE